MLEMKCRRKTRIPFRRFELLVWRASGKIDLKNAKEISPSGSEVTFRQNNILIRCTDKSQSGN